MSGTPQLRSAYPSTPQSLAKGRSQNASPRKATPQFPTLAKPTPGLQNTPTIPFNLVDAPSQRLYVSLIYSGLFIWRIFDFINLPSDGRDGFWLFTKWVGIDTAFLYGLSGLNIPWLQWSSSTFTGLFILHAVVDWMLMFQIPIPIFAWLGVFSKLVYDREYAVSERYVKPASILHNSSVILGKQIIHILPEGSATLNPDRASFCIGEANSAVELPVQINQTQPILMELTRIDLDDNTQEQITVSAKELKKLQKNYLREQIKHESSDPILLRYSVRQTGLYRLQTVIDESKLEVRRRPSYALVVQCPKASIQKAPGDKCKGDLSDFFLQVEATPPLKIKYSKTVNRDDHGHTVLSIQPNDLTSPLASRSASELLFPHDSESNIDVSWARAQSLKVPLNESLGIVGGWQYIIDEVHDACGNMANYSHSRGASSWSSALTKAVDLEQHFFVHERPRFALQGCNAQNPFRVRKGQRKTLPIQFKSLSHGKADPEPSFYSLQYKFTPENEILPDQQHSPSATIHDAVITDNYRGSSGIEVEKPGLYSLDSVSSSYCGGDILEPSSCQLINPTEPDVSIASENITDKCAKRSIGLLVNLDLTGTPPFNVYYDIESGGSKTPKVTQVDRFHTQLELRPFHAGHFTYTFHSVSDAVYNDPRPLDKTIVLTQDVKPPASARFLDSRGQSKACIEEPLSFPLSLTGEPPFVLEYELVHRGRRIKSTIKDIPESFYELKTQALNEGGEYALVLTSVKDATGCKQALDAESSFHVGLQRPRASFGQVDGKRKILALEGKKPRPPVRLQGEPPFELTLRDLSDPSGKVITKELWRHNDEIEVPGEGNYEIIGIHDASCPGTVEASAKDFSVQWIPRPAVSLRKSPLIEDVDGRSEKKAVCEGDEDSTDISFRGNAPYDIQYELKFKSDRGHISTSNKKLTAGLDTASLRMETSEAGVYSYHITKLGDVAYKHDARKFTPMTFHQRVFPRPDASFQDSGKTYKYCQNSDDGAESIPINLSGNPPFHLELEVKHQATTKPERISIPNVELNRHELRLPRRVLALGSHTVSIRKVQDSRGCQKISEVNPPQVFVSVTDVPGISPLEEYTDFCVGDRISYALSGTPPFNVIYTFQGYDRKARVPTTDFRRIAEQPGQFVITAISDSRSTDACRAKVHIPKTIHELPSVRVSKGKTAVVDIHEGGEAEILFEFGGTPPFHFTYTRSTTPTKGRKPTVLETKHGVSHEYRMTIRASDEGLYEVVSIRDKYCAFSAQQVQPRSR